jgi:hypothetical protein
LPLAFQKYEDWNMKNCNVACCPEWVCNLVCHINGRTWAEGVWEHSAEGISGAEREEIKGGWKRLCTQQQS